jgi:hypothetical protein
MGRLDSAPRCGSDTHPRPRTLRQLRGESGQPLELGETLRGEPFLVEGQGMEKINIVTGVKGSGKSHLSKVILIELIKRGAPCIVFDINKEYIHLPRHEMQSDGVFCSAASCILKPAKT